MQRVEFFIDMSDRHNIYSLKYTLISNFKDEDNAEE